MNFRKMKKKRARVDLAPLIDVVFLLLIFFMLTFAVQGQGMDLALPQESPGETATTKPLLISLHADGRIEVDFQEVAQGTLAEALKQRLEKKPDKSVIIQADRRVRYELFAHVLDIARQSGITDYSIDM